MHSAAELRADHDVTGVPAIVRGSVILGLLESVFVLVISLVSRLLPNGGLQTALLGVVVILGLAAVTLLPGLWTRPRTIEGIAGAAGIGLGAAVVYLLIDVTLLQNIGTYGHRWLELGGGSNWWYHPVWWMVGTFLPWMGAWMLANQLAKRGAVSPASAFGTALACAVVLAVLAVVVHFPGAGWNLGTLGVAFLPGLALATALSGLGANRA
ncbi:MAG TPA: hypothetical protein VMY76_07110 [Gemmatimonadales bacterium]|nr:hypothetical protein [Gemmatimonadales bacterium]